MPEEIKEFQINPAEIRTMQKDIARLQREGPQPLEEVLKVEEKPAPLAPAVIDETKKQEILERAREEKRRIEEEQREKEEEQKRQEREKREREEREKIKIGEEKEWQERREKERQREEEQRRIEQKKIAEEERKRRIWQLRRAEEERKRILEEEGQKERKTIEEIRFKAAEEAKKEAKRLAPLLLKQEKEEIRKEIRSLWARKRPLETKKFKLLTEKQVLEKSLKPILNQERQIEEKIGGLEKKEGVAKSFQERQAIEKNRWQLEEERRRIETQKWQKEKQIDEMGLVVKEVGLQIEEIDNEIKGLKRKLAIIKRKEDKVRLEKEKRATQKELTELAEKEIQPLQLEKNRLNEKLNEVEARLKQISDQEKAAEKEKEILEEQEKMAPQPQEKREIENQRWEKEKERKRIEGQRWGIEKEKEKIILAFREIELKLNYILKKQEGLKKKIEEINRFLAEEPEKKIEPGPPPQVREPIPPKVELPKPPPKKPEPAELAKPLSGLREKIRGLREKREVLEQEERQEKLKKLEKIKEKLLEIQTREEKERKEFLERIKEQDKEGAPLKPPELPRLSPSGKKEIIFRPLPEKLSVGEKLWVRLIILFVVLIILAGLITFWYWYINIRPTKTTGGPEKTSPPESNLVIPTSLLTIESLPILDIFSNDEIPTFIFQTINADFQEEEVFRILIRDESQNSIVGLKEFFNAFNVNAPENVYEKLNNESTLFIHSASIGNRLGFITKIEIQENLSQLITSWETSIENDTAELFAVLGKEEKALLPYFKTGTFQGLSFRCQPFSRQDLGICWSIIDDKFIFTTSWATMEKIIETLIQR